jgi:4-hydroxy-3-polyprenylbenzoate decarboxylase
MPKLVLCITAASGSIYAQRFLDRALELNLSLDCIVSENARRVIEYELEIPFKDFKKLYTQRGVKFHSPKDFFSPLASGSRLSLYRAVVVLPCSVSTLGAVASGITNNLIHRVCDVALKERVELILGVREMPLSTIHLENLLKLNRAGAKAFVLSPGFYNKPQTVKDIADFVVGKIFDLLRLEHSIYPRWTPYE